MTLLLWSTFMLVTLVSAGLVIAPGLTLRLANSRLPTKLFASRPIVSTERFFYRHHRAFGAFLMLGSLYTLYRLSFSANPSQMAALLFGDAPSPLLLGLAEGGIHFLWLSNAFIPTFGLIVFARPSLLKELEQWANRRVGDRFNLITNVRHQVRTLAQRHPRTLGVLLLLAGMYLWSMAGFYLSAGY